MAPWKETIVHFKKKLEKGTSEEKTLQILSKLHKVPITVELLQETGIGKCVNTLKKKNGEIGEKAGNLVIYWKQVVSNTNSQRSSSNNTTANSSKQTDRSANGDSSPPEQYVTSHNKSKYTSSNNSSKHSSKHTNRYEKSVEVDTTADSYNPQSTQSDYRNFVDSYQDEYSPPQQNGGAGGSSTSYMPTPKEKLGPSTYNPTSARDDYRSFVQTYDSPTKKNESTTVSSNRSSNNSSKKVKPEVFDNSCSTFEACLGFNDVKVKKGSGSSKGKSSTKLTVSAPDVPSTSRVSHPTKEKTRSSHKHKSSKRSKGEPKLPKELKKTKLPPLEPLEEVDILSTLPQIDPNYKPLRMQYRMPDSPPHKKKHEMTNEEATIYFSSRKEKTAVYAGRRNQYLTEVPSLFESCVRVLVENIDALGHTGGVPYDLLKPVLEKCTPAQLYGFEDYNTYVLEETDELWLVHCQRDFKSKHPDEGETWRDLYLRLHDERDARLKSVTANISASMKKAVPVRQTKLAFVDSVAKPPREVARRQQKHGTSLPVAMPLRAGLTGKGTPRPIMGAINSAAAAAASSGGGPSGFNPLKKPKVAPLMQKTLKFMKQRFRR